MELNQVKNIMQFVIYLYLSFYLFIIILPMFNVPFFRFVYFLTSDYSLNTLSNRVLGVLLVHQNTVGSYVFKDTCHTISNVNVPAEKNIHIMLLPFIAVPHRPSSNPSQEVCTTHAPATASPVPSYFPDGSRKNDLFNVSALGKYLWLFRPDIKNSLLYLLCKHFCVETWYICGCGLWL